jgi:phosphatidylinositol alpha-1,6-mannosyltransferase
VYVHGLDIAVPSRIYQALWIPALLRADHIIANSHATAELAIQVGARAERIGIVHPGVSVPEELQREAASGRFRQKHGLPSSPVLLSVGRLTRRKGLREFITDVLPQVAKSRPGVLLLIVGDTEATALYGAESRESLEIAAKAVGMAENIRFLGKLGEEELEDAYCAADVHVFPIRELPGDPEGFGMVAIEAAAHGLPTVAYSNGGVVDAVRDGVSGRLVAPLDAEGFAGAILQCLTEPLEPAAMRVFASRFEWLEFGRAVRKELAEISVRTDIS